MALTINKLAKLSGVSVRTLHHYDDIGLLKPAYYGDNNYRYYEEAELLQLQQILFYRELGIQLIDIKKILSSPEFDKLSALESHRKILEKNLANTKVLLETVDKTIAHIRGNKIMKLEEIFEGFTDEKQKLYEDFLVKSGVSQDVINNTRNKVKDWNKARWLAHKAEGDAVHEELAASIDKHLSPDSAEVQMLIQKHYELTTEFWTPNKESYIGLSGLYASNPDFVQFYHNIHPELLAYLTKAMKIYAERNLK